VKVSGPEVQNSVRNGGKWGGKEKGIILLWQGSIITHRTSQGTRRSGVSGPEGGEGETCLLLIARERKPVIIARMIRPVWSSGAKEGPNKISKGGGGNCQLLDGAVGGTL